MTTKTVKLGTNQRAILQAMQRRHPFYSDGCGWVWTTHRETVRLLDSLVKHGLVEIVRGTRADVYQLTDAGRVFEVSD